MSEGARLEIAVGDRVRVHLHPAGTWKSFFEGVVSRVDVRTSGGRFFAVEVKHEVILDREHRVRPGFHDYVRYNCPNDFAGRIEILPTAEQEAERDDTSGPEPVCSLLEVEQEPNEQPLVESEVRLEPEAAPEPEAEIASQQTQVDVEPRKASGLMAALFGRKE